MAIQDDFSIDYVSQTITYTPTFAHDRPATIYTVNELYSFLQDKFDEPDQMDDPVPMSAQTPTQYTLINGWYIDDNTIKALYGGSIQTNGHLFAGQLGTVTALRWAAGSTDAPTAADGYVLLTGGTSAALASIMYVDGYRDIAWVRNLNGNQFSDGENVTGSGVDINLEATSGVQSGESIWSNLFSVGSLQTETEIYVGQEDDHLGGIAYHTADGYQRRIEKLDEWWDSDVDFFTGSPNLLGGAGHFDILVKTQESGGTIDGQRLAVYSRQASKVYSHFELVGGVGNFVVPFASTGADLNAADGPYVVSFDGKTGNDLLVGDVIENGPHGAGSGANEPLARLRAVVTAVTGGDGASGTFDYYLIGENEPSLLAQPQTRTLKQFQDNDDLKVRGDTTDFDINGIPTLQGPALNHDITITFGNTQVDIDQDTIDEEYACTIDCSLEALADVYKRVMFLTSRGNQDGTVFPIQDELVFSARDGYNEAGEFYRGVGDILFDWDTKVGSAPIEGKYVTNAGDTKSGVLVSLSGSAGSSGIAVLTQTKGSWADGDEVAEPNGHGFTSVLINEPTTGVISITDNTAAPFGTFAGGRWFVARGVVLINVPAADNNNWETVALGSTAAVSPPTTITITFAGLVANDRAALFEVNTSGGSDIRKDQNGIGSISAIGSATLTLNATIALDVPETGWVRVTDTSDAANGTEFRYEYSSISTTTITLRTGANLSGTDDGAGSTTRLIDVGGTIFTNYGTDGNVKTGMIIRDASDNFATVVRKVGNDEIETTVLSGGASWNAGTAWEANSVAVATATDDTVYFGFIDDEATGSSLSKNVKFVENTNLIARARFSSSAVGGTRILPFEQKTIQLTNADLTVTAIRTDDTIVS